METTFIPQRGVDFDDFIGSIYFNDEKGLVNVSFLPVFCPANEKHSDDFVGISYQGYTTKAVPEKGIKRGIWISGIMYPAKNFTKEDIDRLFDKVEAEDGTVQYRAKSSLAFDEVYIRVCYSKQEGKEDNIKWVSAIDGGEVFVLHGDRRVYSPKDAEA